MSDSKASPGRLVGKRVLKPVAEVVKMFTAALEEYVVLSGRNADKIITSPLASKTAMHRAP